MQTSPLFAKRQHPIFVLGILQRSGTNYLNNLLLLHPDMQSPGMVWEDFYLAQAEHLSNYAEATQKRWGNVWTKTVSSALGQGALLAHLGQGIVSLMENQYAALVETGKFSPPAQTPIRLVTATPSVNNLHLFFELFPQGAPIIIVRDGPALVESGVRSFGWDYDEAMYLWAERARDILAFCRAPEHQGKFFLVQYRDLYTRNRQTMTQLLNFLGLDPSRYDFDAAENLKVMGSSEVAAKEGALHWKEVKKPHDFNPLTRAHGWGLRLKCRFAWMGGKEMRAFGYTLEDQPRRPIWNSFMDRLYGLEIKLKQTWPRAATWVRRWRAHLPRAPLHAPLRDTIDAHQDEPQGSTHYLSEGRTESASRRSPHARHHPLRKANPPPRTKGGARQHADRIVE